MAIKEIEFKVELTPQLLAQGFWELSSMGQALFFDELYVAMCGDVFSARRVHENAEMQWTWLADSLKKYPKGLKTFKHMAETVMADEP